MTSLPQTSAVLSQQTIKHLERLRLGEPNLKDVDMSLERILRNTGLIENLAGSLQEISSLGTEKESQFRENIITFCWQTLQEVASTLRLIALYPDYPRLTVLNSCWTLLVQTLTVFTSYTEGDTTVTKS